MNWTKEKPVFTEDCVLVVADKFGDFISYDVYEIKQIDNGEGKYMAWLDGYGNEIDDIGELTAGLYCILPKHPDKLITN